MTALQVFEPHGVTDQFATYRIRLRIIDRIVGGIPSSKSVIKGWLKARMQLGDAELQHLVDETLMARFADRQPGPDELAEAIMQTEAAPSINGFKRIVTSGELAVEGRIIKAMIKEATNSAYPGLEWDGKPPPKKPRDGSTPRRRLDRPSDTGLPLPSGFPKGAQNTLVERVFVEEILVGLGVRDPQDIGGRVLTEERIKRVMTPQGKVSAIARVEVVLEPTIEFTLRVRDDFLPWTAWGRIWQAAEQIGLGSDRARGDGRFELMTFDRC
ncbi:hypothetical protein [Spongiactinospora sp. TRM90649]|uniref:hypothetical protein n=1 Tax=Spongiactinospora sp. TRM90649 TaxID=3031114 RepID=UPI0023F9F906|nr:hypothetical protein [Spongiactinospora sp. TRM90649]MDF5756607.1 hypothetical protein [Spongiactinospora sp. TRM90649]